MTRDVPCSRVVWTNGSEHECPTNGPLTRYCVASQGKTFSLILLIPRLYTIEAIADGADVDLFGKMADPRYCVHYLLPLIKSCNHYLRPKGHI